MRRARPLAVLGMMGCVIIVAACRQQPAPPPIQAPRAAPTPASKPTAPERDGLWRQLVSDFRLYNLPLPPDTATAVRYSASADKVCVGFQLNAAASPPDPVILEGTEVYRPRSAVSNSLPEGFELCVIDGDQSGSDWDLALRTRSGPYGLNSALATAIQCKLRGWDQLAERMLSRALGERGCDGDFRIDDDKLTPQIILAQLAWGHWCEELADVRSDRREILSHLKLVRSRLGESGSPRLDLTIRSLELNLVPSRAAAGSVESMVDALTDMRTTGILTRLPDEREPAYARIATLGFDAVPALMRHVDDRRLTRIVHHRLMNRLPYVVRVGDVVSSLLAGLSGYRLEWVRNGDGTFVKEASLAAWWQQAQRQGELAYAVEHAYVPRKGRSGLNDVLTYVISQKHPQQLPLIYRRLLDHREQEADDQSAWPPEIPTWPMVNFILMARLSPEAKIEMLQQFAEEDRQARKALLRLNATR